MAVFIFSKKQSFLGILCCSRFRILDYNGDCKLFCDLSELESLVKEEQVEKKTTDPKQELSVALGHGVVGAFSPSGNLFAICTNRKTLVVWNTSSWEYVSKRKLTKRATAISFTQKEDTVIIADKAGDVYQYSAKDSVAKPSLLLGHLSMIMDMVVTDDNKFIVTADRDEKIRVSHYPNSYNIEAFCLQHQDFVSKICLLSKSGVLASGGGDGSIHFWDFRIGRLLHTEQMEEEKGQQITEDGNKEKQKVSEVVACMACCQKNHVVCVVGEGSCEIQLFSVHQKSVTKLDTIVTSTPPWHVTFDPDGRLWCVQPNPKEPVLIFQAKCTGPDLKFSKLESPAKLPIYTSASDWQYLEECTSKEPHLSTLRKKEVDNMTEYLTRKEERIKQKKDKIAAMSSPAKKIKVT
ncbi:tRNA (guanine-N(7)-)-methyltransferase non-catalytic subunit wdr4 isoform X2 [Nematostella vectensis]|uniref:tRNA (guanine-N(7)-)-methyltransferase non-catalytic subunit wdr4 isoform X2 n=1 Tax=Nematostella vectensis TaxID=45351 RepID=UPI0020772F18|nr:tRNA (guanine-N(7)-)-methyltransferase non-catalytic subunit wdr4 isoform X2 [Nematostella vectensis]